jgi:hypothetical protein
MRRALALGIAATAMLVVVGVALPTAHDNWQDLRRPLQIPRLAPGQPCPASKPDTSVDFASYGVGQGYGPGPAYPIFGGNAPRARLDFDYPPTPQSEIAGSKWGAQKVLWFLLPGHGDRVLVRGRRLDGQHPFRVRFGLGPRLPGSELKIARALDHPSTTRLRTGGCYGYQIDGPDYSRMIVFKANLRCRAARVHGDVIHVGPFKGGLDPDYDIVNGRFRLQVGGFRDRATGLSQKIPWFLPSRYRSGGWLILRGRQLAPPGRSFVQHLPEAGSADRSDHVFPSVVRPPRSGCWQLTLRTGRVQGSVRVLVRGRG